MNGRRGSSAAPDPSRGRVLLWRGADGYWRYRYVGPPMGLPIESNRSYLTRDEAMASAGTAYPGVPSAEVHASPGTTPTRRRWMRILRRLWTLGLVLWVLRSSLRLLFRLRRSGRKARKIAGWASLAGSLAARSPTRDDEAPR